MRTVQRFLAVYADALSLSEIRDSLILRLAFGSLAFSYYITFSRFFYSIDTTVEGVASNTNVCWQYFQNCRDLLFLHTLPYGYSQPILYMGLMGLIFLCAYFLFTRNIVGAQLALIPAFLWHIAVCFLLTSTLTGNYDYYIALFGVIVLFLPHKLFFLRAVLVLFYFLSTYTKIYPSWVLGTYFSALQTGIPIFPDAAIPLWTNLVIIMEMLGAWLLFSSKRLLQRAALVFFAAFHLYSGILVGYLYPSIVLPMLLILFGPLYRPMPVPLDRRSIAGWCVLSAVVGIQVIAPLIPGDAKLTLEGNRFAIYMFEANHQCISSGTIEFRDGRTQPFRSESVIARYRCDPYRYWFQLKTRCDEDVSRISWTFDHTINGGPFLRIVDVDNACALSYKPFSHNAWIKTEFDSPEIVGYPVKNWYR